jgi:peptidase E
MDDRSPALDRLVLSLTRKAVPKVCFLPTASGDPREQATRFYERYAAWPCEPSILSLFHLGRDRIDPHQQLLDQDAIYVGGGSMRNMLAVWREHGVDRTMRRAWDQGIVLAGLSAGAMCWFQGGITVSGGAPAPAAGLGFLPASLSVHLDSEPERQSVYRQAIREGTLASGYAVDDCAALVFEGLRLAGCVASRAGARVIETTRDGVAGDVLELPLAVKLLPGARAPGSEGEPASDGIAELRALRAGRHRWE